MKILSVLVLIIALVSCKKDEENSCLEPPIGEYSYVNGPYDTLVNTASQMLVVQKQVTPDFDAVNDQWIIQSTGYDKIYLTISACGLGEIVSNEEKMIWCTDFDDFIGVYQYKIIAHPTGGSPETYKGNIDLMNAEKD